MGMQSDGDGPPHRPSGDGEPPNHWDGQNGQCSAGPEAPRQMYLNIFAPQNRLRKTLSKMGKSRGAKQIPTRGTNQVGRPQRATAMCGRWTGQRSAGKYRSCRPCSTARPGHTSSSGSHHSEGAGAGNGEGRGAARPGARHGSGHSAGQQPWGPGKGTCGTCGLGEGRWEGCLTWTWFDSTASVLGGFFVWRFRRHGRWGPTTMPPDRWAAAERSVATFHPTPGYVWICVVPVTSAGSN